MRNDINIIDTCSNKNTDNEAITIRLKNTEDQLTISIIYIPSASSINTSLLENIKNSADNIIITGDLNAKYTDFADNSIPTYRDSRTNTSDIIDYVISSPAIFGKIQNLSLNCDLSSDHSAIPFDFLTNLNKCIIPPIKVKLYHKAEWDSINSSLSNQLTILQDQIVVDLLSSKKADPINIINNAATILTDSILNIYNTLPEKTIKPKTSLPFDIQLLIKQKRKIKRAFIKTRNPFLKTVMNATSKKIKKQIKIHRTTDIQN